MPTDLPHLAASVFNTPLLVHRGKLDTILSAVGPRILTGEPLGSDVRASEPRRDRAAFSGSARRHFSAGGYLAEDGIAVLPVHGTLIRRGSWLDSLSGMTSYGAIMDGVSEILSDGQVRGMMMEFDTPGGEAGGVFDLAEFIRSAAESTGKPVWAHANELAASAGYALASTADRIWLSTTGEVGSIGVVAAHIDMSKADEKAGLKWTYVYAGEEKVDGNAHEPLSDRARDTIADDVDDLYSMFVELVAQNRAIPVADIRATNARVYRGTRALDIGLADDLGTFDEAMQSFALHLDEMQSVGGPVASASSLRRSLMAGRNTGTTRSATEQEPEPAPAAPAAPAAPVEPAAPAPAPSAPVAPEPTEAEQASASERKRCADLTAISAQASRMGVAFNVADAIGKGTSASAAREAVMNAASEKDAAAATTAHATSRPGGGSEITAEARKSAWSKAMKRR